MLSGVSSSATDGDAPQADGIVPGAGIDFTVLAAAIAFCVAAGLVGLVALVHQEPPSVLLFAGWPAFALAGGVVLDRRTASRVGQVLTTLALMPAVVLLWAAVRFGLPLISTDLLRAASETVAVQGTAVALAVPWAFRTPRPRPLALGSTAVAVVGALVVTATAVGGGSGLRFAGWCLVVLGCGGVWVLSARTARENDRITRRRVSWVLFLLALSAVVLVVSWRLVGDGVANYVTATVLVVIALAATRLCSVADFRPLDEHVLDLAVIAGAVAVAALMALLVRLGAGWRQLPSPNTSAAFSAVLTVAVAAPAALWVRRSALARRYGSGIISPSDVAVITADLHAQTEPRALLDKAARMVATASGSRQALIVLGEVFPSVPEHWDLHPLVVGGDRVGALAVESGDPEGPELRQQKIVAQLRPTVALVARAVGLAVEAEHARRDLSRERDAERRRILGDLHDGLGPVLAGMSMRVQATLRSSPPSEYSALLSDLSAGLAASRTDLRRIVAGIAPTTLDGGDLTSALSRLVESFRGVSGGPEVTLDIAQDIALVPELQVAVYRSVAEGVTNALRHAEASVIDVHVGCSRGLTIADVVDDGRGGPVVPGVGLSSLKQRADGLGGCLEVFAVRPHGTRLHLELPTGDRANR
jgi:signal transduction histidine kinase